MAEDGWLLLIEVGTAIKGVFITLLWTTEIKIHSATDLGNLGIGFGVYLP